MASLLQFKVLITNNSHQVLYDLSQLLNTQLDRETLATCVSLIERGVNPEALAVRINLLLGLIVIEAQ